MPACRAGRRDAASAHMRRQCGRCVHAAACPRAMRRAKMLRCARVAATHRARRRREAICGDTPRTVDPGSAARKHEARRRRRRLLRRGAWREARTGSQRRAAEWQLRFAWSGDPHVLLPQSGLHSHAISVAAVWSRLFAARGDAVSQLQRLLAAPARARSPPQASPGALPLGSQRSCQAAASRPSSSSPRHLPPFARRRGGTRCALRRSRLLVCASTVLGSDLSPLPRWVRIARFIIPSQRRTAPPSSPRAGLAPPSAQRDLVVPRDFFSGAQVPSGDEVRCAGQHAHRLVVELAPPG